MRLKIAVITGASSGMGREFARQISRCYPWLDELWLLGRNRQRLEAVKETLEMEDLPRKMRIRLIPCDLGTRAGRDVVQGWLMKECPAIKLLVNAAGTGVIGRIGRLPVTEQTETVRVNCEALTAVTCMCLPYLKKGSHIIQMASAAAFFPQPGFAVYAASKSYVLSFSLALRREMADQGVTVTAVCPGPVDTPFFGHAETYEKRPAYKQKAMADPKKVVRQAIEDAAVGRSMSIYGAPAKALAAACRLLPQSFLTWAADSLKNL